MKTLIQLTAIMFFTMITVACSSDSSGTATTASAAVCKNSAGVAVVCDETNSSNSGSQVVADGATPTNASQVPNTAQVQVHQTTRVTDAQINAKAAEVRAAVQRISDDPESGISGTSTASTASASAASAESVASSDSSDSSYSPTIRSASRPPSSVSTQEAAVAGSTSDSGSSGGTGNTVW